MTSARVAREEGPTTLAAYHALSTYASPLLETACATNPQDRLATGTRLRRSWPADLVATAFTLAELRDRASVKFPDGPPPWLTREALEQASGSGPADWRAREFSSRLAEVADARRRGRAGRRVVLADLGCGIGADTIAFARAAAGGGPPDAVLAVDRDPVRAWCAAANARACGLSERVGVAVADVRSLRLSADGPTAAFVDPARRSGGRRTRADATDPPLEWAVGLADALALVAVKTAPGIPRAAIPVGWDVDFVAVGRDLKEAVLWSPRSPGERSPREGSAGDGSRGTPPGTRRAVVLTPGREDVLVVDPDVPPAPRGEPGPWLLDPNPAVTRAGAVADLARSIGGWQIDPLIAFLCVPEAVRTPFARLLRVEASLPFDLRRVRTALRSLDIGPLEVRRRGLAGDVDDIRRRVRGPGSRTGILVMTRVDDVPWALVCTDGPS